MTRIVQSHIGHRFTGLWCHPDFLRLWAAQAISQLGSQITLFAIPLTAVLLLNSSAAEMGILIAAGQAPFLLLGLFAGVWVDRVQRRPILIAADLGRSFLLLLIPMLAVFDALQIEYLYVIVFLIGIHSVFFDVASHAYLPALVARAELTEANSKLALSRSVAQVVGPGAAGGLVYLVTAPIVIAVDAVSYLVSAVLIYEIRRTEPEPPNRKAGQHLVGEIREGIGAVVGNPLLRPIAAATATVNLFLFVIRAVLILYATRMLGIGPELLGLIFAVGSLGALLGAAVASPLSARLHVGPSIVAGSCIAACGMLLIPLADGPKHTSVPILTAAQVLGALGGTIYNINQVSLRQAITPDHLLGRMTATMRFIVWGTIPIGGLLGGLLGETIGLRPTLIAGAVGGSLSVLWVGFSRVRTIRDVSSPGERSMSAS